MVVVVGVVADVLDPDDGVTVMVVVSGVTGLVAAAAGTDDERDHGERDGAGHGAQSALEVVVEGSTAGITGHKGATTTLHRPPREPRSLRGRARRIPASSFSLGPC